MLWYTFLLNVLFINSALSLDPYEVLEVPKTASLQDIRKHYKQLVVEWHPDKNNDPTAQEKFLQLTEAYNILSDSERRKQYDLFGKTDSLSGHESASRKFHNHMYNPFDEVFSEGFNFPFEEHDISLFHKLSITHRNFEKTYVPKSFSIPHLILFYSDWCFACLQVEPIFKKLMDELTPLGVGFITVHVHNEQSLARRLGIGSQLPQIALLTDGRASLFKEPSFSVQKMVEFFRLKLPYKMFVPISEANVDAFLDNWKEDNKVHALLFQKTLPVRLRYLINAFKHRQTITFGIIAHDLEDSASLFHRFKVPTDKDSLLIFKEDTERPSASITMKSIPIPTLQDITNNNHYLTLPRISSQSMLDAVCPVKKLCVILFSEDSPQHDASRHSLRKFAQESRFIHNNIAFMYVFMEKQPEFVNALTTPEDNSEISLHIAAMWRMDYKKVKYGWLLGDDIDDWKDYNTTKDRLDAGLRSLVNDPYNNLLYDTALKGFSDEYIQSLGVRIINRIFMHLEMAQQSLSRQHILPAVSLICTVIIIIVLAMIMNHYMKLEEEEIRKSHMQSDSSSYSSESTASTTSSMRNHSVNKEKKHKEKEIKQELKLHALRAETYNGLCVLLKPGCRTLILFIDNKSSRKLVSQFHAMVWPYRKNKSLMFGYLNIERKQSREWFKDILLEALPPDTPLAINPRNCIGTVLSINGYRKYFCMYHAKLTGQYGAKSKDNTIKGKGLGAYLGYNDSDYSDTDEEADLERGLHKHKAEPSPEYLLEDKLLDGFPNWLDRLFEGTTPRFYIEAWPEFKVA